MSANNEPRPLYTQGGQEYKGAVSYVNGQPYQAGTPYKLYDK